MSQLPTSNAPTNGSVSVPAPRGRARTPRSSRKRRAADLAPSINGARLRAGSQRLWAG
jgi:hypothetical protein